MQLLVENDQLEETENPLDEAANQCERNYAYIDYPQAI